MGNKKTPLIQQLRETGGTLYVFPSANEDVGLNLQSTTTGVAMSHYALINIPELSIQQCLCDSECKAQNGNEALAMSLQNYAMNFETLLTNREQYNYQALSTVSEKVFWHWAQKIGIINKDNFTNQRTSDKNIYVELGKDRDKTVTDNTVIKCFGAIDAGNSLSTEFGMYNETYINIPTSYGAGPVYLKQCPDDNYQLDQSYAPIDGDRTHLEGRGDEFLYYSYTQGQDIPFFDSMETGTYNTFDEFDALEILKDIPTIQSVVRQDYENDAIIVGSYDDINIDTDNHFDVDVKFDFNAILLYYSVYDQDDLVKTAYATNLFGVIFLDGCRMTATSENDSFYIVPKTKMKSTTSTFGDSFSFRVNIKTMSVYDNTDAIIQDNTTMSGIAAVDFSDAISNMNQAIDIMNQNLHVVSDIQDKYASIMTYYNNFEADIKDLSTCINAYLRGSRSSVVNTSTLYTNVIIPNPENENNDIIISTVDAVNGADIKISDVPSVHISKESVSIPTLNSKTTTFSKNYVIEEYTSSEDVSIMNSSYAYSKTQVDASTAYHTVQNMFNNFDSMSVKLKQDGDFMTLNGVVHNKVYNQLYIDPESPIFEYAKSEGAYNVNYLKNADGNINYVGMVPYLVAQVQKLTVDLNNAIDIINKLLVNTYGPDTNLIIH